MASEYCPKDGEPFHTWVGTLGRCIKCDQPMEPPEPEDPLFTRQYEESAVDPDPDDDPEEPPRQREIQVWDIYPDPELFPPI